MNPEADDPRPPEMPFGFDEAGIVPAVWPEAIEPEADATPREASGCDYGRLLALLTTGAPDADTIAWRALLLAYAMKSEGGPQTLADIARVMTVSRQAAWLRLTRFRALLPAIAREVGFDG